MNRVETILRKAVGAILVVGSASMLVPLAFAFVALIHGAALPRVRWLLPLAVFLAGSALTWLGGRRRLSLRPQVILFALWLLAAAYYWAGALG